MALACTPEKLGGHPPDGGQQAMTERIKGYEKAPLLAHTWYTGVEHVYQN